MTTEDDFQAALDKDPSDWQTRLVFADWLQERGDERAEGYRALGVSRLYPNINHTVFYGTLGDQFRRRPVAWYDASLTALGHAQLPHWWHEVLFEHIPGLTNSTFETRREAEDAAALAFLLLSDEYQAEILAGER